MNTDTSPPEGYITDAVEAWVARHVDELTPPFEWTRLAGGRSNLTYKVRDQSGRVAVIRRPPQGKLLPKAHDMSREWALISALGPTPVPVPAAYAFCDDPEVTGAWFYVMGYVDGRPLYSADDTNLLIPETERRRMAHSLIDSLAALHAVDPDDVGLGELGKKDGYVGRQLKTWYRSWTSSVERAQYDDARAHELHQFFLENVPEQGPARVVHGDYGPHNVLIGSDCRIAAVVDWELSTLGDPLADLTYSLNQWPDPTDVEPFDPCAPTAPPGFPSRSDLAKRYSDKTGRVLSNLDYYHGFNHWKSAAILHGVYARYRHGQKKTEGEDPDAIRARVGEQLTKAERAVARLIK